MKIEMTVVYIIVAALVIVPYIAIIFFGSGKGKKISSRFKEEVKNNGLHIAQKEAWNRHIIGVDNTKNILLFAQYNEENVVDTFKINLNEVDRVDVFEKKNTIKLDNKPSEVLEYIGLDVLLFDGRTHEICFYDTHIDVAQNYEQEHAEKWRAILVGQKNSKMPIKNTTAA
ncbi:hypothetical protein [Flavimarina sp. Hel_I_48]|uniref:hypothetical protein n=1 Tax=Flavimarina sp. Hel_I_48 TaxID=1392488 RepID=UPI0004DF3090|nr:hypothetical protein [Flavimarina sp. Hel_I_48]